MGHITIDSLEEAWSELDRAKYYLDEESYQYALTRCEKTLELAEKSVHSMGFESWFAEQADPLTSQLAELQRQANPSESDVADVITLSETLLYATKDQVIPELHKRTDYTAEPTFE